MFALIYFFFSVFLCEEYWFCKRINLHRLMSLIGDNISLLGYCSGLILSLCQPYCYILRINPQDLGWFKQLSVYFHTPTQTPVKPWIISLLENILFVCVYQHLLTWCVCLLWVSSYLFCRSRHLTCHRWRGYRASHPCPASPPSAPGWPATGQPGRR